MITNTCPPSDVVIKSVTSNVICINDGCLTSNNPVASRMYKVIPLIYRFYAEVFGLCGIDGRGTLPHFEINWDVNNAAWTCDAGKPCVWKFHNALAMQPEVIAHEYAHAILNGRLRYQGQSGALEESKADVLAIAFKQWCTSSNLDWKVGSIRDLSQKRTFQNFKNGRIDFGYVHENSKIPSHAFYCTVTETNTLACGILAHIWLGAYKNVRYDESFSDFAFKTISQAAKIATQPIQGALVRSWVYVGVLEFVPQRAPQRTQPLASNYDSNNYMDPNSF